MATKDQSHPLPDRATGLPRLRPHPARSAFKRMRDVGRLPKLPNSDRGGGRTMPDTHDRPLREGHRGDVLRVLVSWETAQDIAAVKAPGVQETPHPCSRRSRRSPSWRRLFHGGDGAKRFCRRPDDRRAAHEVTRTSGGSSSGWPGSHAGWREPGASNPMLIAKHARARWNPERSSPCCSESASRRLGGQVTRSES